MTSPIASRATLLVLLAFGSTAQIKDTAWLDVPYVRQIGSGCGPAAIAMVMQYWIRQDTRADTRMAAAADGDRIYRLLAANSEEEISGAALQRYLEDHGFSAFVFNGQLQDFRNHLDKGRPLIVCFAPRGSREPLHYAVIVGMTEKDIFMNDPSRGRLTRESVDHFMRGWKATGNWTLLAVPASPQLR